MDTNKIDSNKIDSNKITNYIKITYECEFCGSNKESDFCKCFLCSLCSGCHVPHINCDIAMELEYKDKDKKV